MRIILADNDYLFAYNYGRGMDARGVAVLPFSAADAVSSYLLDSSIFVDLVIASLHLPHNDCLSLAACLAEPALAHIPFMVLYDVEDPLLNDPQLERANFLIRRPSQTMLLTSLSLSILNRRLAAGQV